MRSMICIVLHTVCIRGMIKTDIKVEYKLKFNLERQVSMMAVDGVNERVYVISVNPNTYELELGYYKIDL